MARQPKAKGSPVLRLIDCRRERDNAKARQIQAENASILRCLMDQNNRGELGVMVVSADNRTQPNPVILCTGNDTERGLYLTSRAIHIINVNIDG